MKTETAQAKHTPGPWVLHEYGNGKNHSWTVGLPPAPIAEIASYCSADAESESDQAVTAEANARLIAAAPELLKAVKQLAAYYNDEIELNGTAIKFMLDEAISKAEGK